MASERQLLNFIVEKDLLNRIDDFRFQNRFATRAGAIKWLLNNALEQQPIPRSLQPPVAPEPPVEHVPVSLAASASASPSPISLSPPTLPVSRDLDPAPSEPTAPPVTQTPRNEPSHESVVQALKAQGYEVGETAFQDGQVRIVVRSSDGSALVTVGQELYELAAGRLTLGQIAARRRGA